MNNVRIEYLIPIAMNKVSNLGFLTVDGKLPSNYSGYVDSFGPSVRQSGLMQAVAFNEKNDKRKLINRLLFEVLKEGEGEILNAFVTDIAEINDLVKLVGSVSSDNLKKKKLESLVFEAVVACKLAMKTFHKIKAVDNE